MSLWPFIEWCNNFWVGTAIRNSTWLFPLIETVHLLALTLLLGSIIVVSLRIFGIFLRRQRLAQVAGEFAPWTLGALIVMLLSGSLLFLSEATKCYDSPPFRVKMVFLVVAILYHFTVFRKMTRSLDPTLSALWCRVGAGMSLALWFAVGLAGRAIGFY